MIDKHSMGPLMVEFLAEASLVAMANLYPEWVHIQVRKNPVPFMRKISSVSYLPPSILLVHLGNDVISGAQDLFLYWHIKHTALGVAWSVLVKERTYFESINSLYSWHYKHFVKDPWPSTVVAWGRNWHSPMSLCLLLRAFSAVNVLWWLFIWDINTFKFCANSEKPILIPLL